MCLVDEIKSLLGRITVTRDIEDYEKLAFDAATATNPQTVVNTFLWFYNFYVEVTEKINKYGEKSSSKTYYDGYFIEDNVLKYVEKDMIMKVHEMTNDDYKELIYEFLYFTWKNVDQFFSDEYGKVSKEMISTYQDLICNLRQIEKDYELDYPWDLVYECDRDKLNNILKDFDNIKERLSNLKCEVEKLLKGGVNLN